MKITGRHLVITPALKRHIRDKFERLARYGVAVDRIQVVLIVNKLQHAAEAVCAMGSKRFQAKTETREMYATIDLLVDRLETQIRKYKERRSEHKGRHNRVPPAAVVTALGDDEIKVVRPKLSVLSRETARDQLDSNPGSLVVYTCRDSGKLQILQRGESGQVVLIDPLG